MSINLVKKDNIMGRIIGMIVAIMIFVIIYVINLIDMIEAIIASDLTMVIVKAIGVFTLLGSLITVWF